MGFRGFIEAGVVKLLLAINKKNVYEAARDVGGAIDKGLDERYGAQKSESVQASMCSVIKVFCNSLIIELQKDWTEDMKKRHADTLILPAKELGAPLPKPKPEPKPKKAKGKVRKSGKKKQR